MKTRFTAGMAAGCLLGAFVLAVPAAPPATGAVARVRVELSDGTRVAILPAGSALRVRTSYGDISIPWEKLKSASSVTGRWEVLLRNGDRIQGVSGEPSMKGVGPLGRLTVPCAAIASVRPLPPPPAAASAGDEAGEAAPEGTITLRDRSSINVALRTRRLVLRTLHLGTIEIPAGRVATVETTPVPGRVALDSGDVLAGVLETESVEAASSFGDVRLAMTNIVRIALRRRASAGGWPAGLVAYYPLDEAGPAVRDASGSGNDGESHGARFAEAGAVGGCFEFRGGPDEGDFIRVPHSASLVSMQETRELTLCAWIRPRSIPREFPVVLGKGGNQPPDCNGGYELYINSYGDDDLTVVGDTIVFLTKGAGGRLVNRRMNRWIHVAVALVSRSDRADFAFYVNGVRSDIEKNVGNRAGLDNRFDVPNDLYIGGPDPRHHRNRAFFDGWIDEVMIFNRRLAAEEIRALYDAGAGHVHRSGPEGEAAEGPDPATGSDPRPAVPQRRTPELRQVL